MTRRGIALVPANALTVTQNDPEFSPLVADTLGNNLTDSDGWDKDVAALAALFDGGDDLLSAMAGHIVEADFKEGDLDGALLAPLRGDVSDFGTAGDPLFQAVHDAVTADPSNPPPPGAPPPPNPCTPTLANPWPCGFHGPPDTNPV